MKNKVNYFTPSSLLLLIILLFMTNFAYGSSLRQIRLDWEMIESATQYEIRITFLPRPGVIQPPRIIKTKKLFWRGALKPGNYTMELRSLDSRGVAGSWSEPNEFSVKLEAPKMKIPADKSKIYSKDHSTEKVLFKWKPVAFAKEYKINIYNKNDELITSETTDKNSIKISLEVANEYKWSISALDSDEKEGDLPIDKYEFTIIGAQLSKAELTLPITKYVTSLNWKPVEHAQSYNWKLSYFKQNKWFELKKVNDETQTEIKFDISQPSGNYRLDVIAQAPLRKNSKSQFMEFEVRGDIRNIAAIEEAQLRDSMEKTTNYYAIASYLVTQLNYQGIDYESNSQSKFNVLGGTGRLGMGYQSSQSGWGYFGILDLSGFDLQDNRHTFAALELHSTYKHFWNQNQIIYRAGIFYKELPEVSGNSTQGFNGLGKAKGIGPHLGLIIWRPMSQRLGIQVQAQSYYSLVGNGYNGESTSPSLSYQIGLLGSYRISNQSMGYLGIITRSDQLIYSARPFSESNPNSFAQDGDLNKILIQGNYLNLKWEYSF